MKKYFFFLALVFFSFHKSQSTERFIRIVGNSAYTFKADSYRVYFNVSEILPNEYAKTEYKSLESNQAELNENLKKLGVKENQLMINYKNRSLSYSGAYGNAKMNFFYIDIDNKDLLNKILALKSNGFKIEMTKFIFNDNKNAEFDLAKSAIEDAKRKAEKIAKEINMKVGKILNIEDKTSDCCSNLGELDSDQIGKKYTINVTYQLLD